MVGASITTDKDVYLSGEPIRVVFEVFSRAPTAVRLDFASGQRFDITVEDRHGREVWRWSADRMFTMALGQEMLGPDGPGLTYEAEVTAELEPGGYRIRGVLTDASRGISAAIDIEVR